MKKIVFFTFALIGLYFLFGLWGSNDKFDSESKSKDAALQIVYSEGWSSPLIVLSAINKFDNELTLDFRLINTQKKDYYQITTAEISYPTNSESNITECRQITFRWDSSDINYKPVLINQQLCKV